MRISERLLTALVACLLAAAVPSFAKGSSEQRLKDAQRLLAQAQEPLQKASDLFEKEPLSPDDYAAAMAFVEEALKPIAEATTLLDQVKQSSPELPGVPQTALDLVGALLEAKQYTAAMTRLVQALTDFPDYRSDIDKLIARVMEVRRRFNEKYRELLAAIEGELSDETIARGLALIRELQLIDPNPDKTLTTSIDLIRQALENRKITKEFIAVMNAASSRLAEERFVDAVTLYLGGFTIGRELFDRASYPSLVRDQVLSLVADIERTAREAMAQYPGQQALAAALDTLLGSTVTTSGRAEFGESLDLLAAAPGLEQQMRALAARIPDLQSAIVRSQGDSGRQNYWLYLVEQYALGRPKVRDEGLVFAMRRSWVGAARVLADEAAQAVESAYRTLDEAFAAEADAGAFSPLADALRERGQIALDVIAVEQPAYTMPGYTPTEADRERAAGLAATVETVRRYLSDADARDAFTAARGEARAALANLEGDLNGIRDRSAAERLIASARSGTSAWSGRAEAAVGSAMQQQAAAVRDAYASLAARALDRDTTLAVDQARIETSGFAGRITAATSLQEEGRRLAEGTGGDAGPRDKRPELASAKYVQALADVDSLLSDIDAWNARWSAEPARVKDSAGLVAEFASTSDTRAEARTLRAAIDAAATAERTAIDLARQLRGQADSAYAAGQNEEKQKKYTNALASFTTARDSYAASLGRQENAAARSRLEELAAVIARVTERAREQNLAEVQVLIEQGVRQFTDTDYESAVATLERARELWEAAAGGENITIEVYLARARAALRMMGKQEITRADPIYEDIRGFMTQAELSYTKAISLQKTDSGSEAYGRAITSARGSVQAITTVVPEYREARLLALKIDRLELGTDKFAAELRKRVDAALASSRDAEAGEIVLRNALFSLRDYKVIEGADTILSPAKRREIDAAIVDLEIALGLRDPPVSGPDQRASQSLYQQALAEYRRNVNDRVLWESALFLLQQSLERNLRNTDAQKLRNEIVVKRGTLEDVLTTTELAGYRTALTDFTNRNYATAGARVDQLLGAKPRNPLLLQLKQQIGASR